MFKDYKSKNNKWYTFRPLPLFKREELSKRFNNFDKLRKISAQILDDDFYEYNLIKILELYNLDFNEFEIEELDDLLLNYILKVNYSDLELQKPKLESLIKERNKHKISEHEESEIMSKLFSSIWGICENAGDALYMVDKLPADLLLSTIKNRSEDLEKMYSTEKDKQKKEQKNLKEQLLKRSNEKR